MWADFYRRWVDVCCWWLPKAEDGQDSGATTDRPRTTASSEVEAIEGRTDGSLQDSAADDLTVIKGVGPATMKKLRGFGIMSFADLAAFDPDELTRRLGASQPISTTRVKRWDRPVSYKEASDEFQRSTTMVGSRGLAGRPDHLDGRLGGSAALYRAKALVVPPVRMSCEM